MFIYYTTLTVLAIFSQLVILTILKSDNLMPKESKRYFILAFITFILATFLEWFSEVIKLCSNDDNFHYTLVQAIMHIIIPLTPYFLGSAFKKFNNLKPFKVLFVINIFLELLSFSPSIENSFYNLFEPGNIYLIYFFILIYVIFKMFANIYQVSKLYQSGVITLLMINIFIVLNFAIVVQSVSGGINTIYITATANAIIIYYYFGSLINKRDGLTLLLNRRCFENRIRALKHDSIFLFIDLNSFKEINDVHGHLMGDKMLKEIADICLETFNLYGNAYRIGGDEYCIIIKKHLHDIETLIATFHKNIGNRKETIPLLPSVSVGYGYFFYKKNTVNDALSEADAMMYKVKNKHKVSKLKI